MKESNNRVKKPTIPTSTPAVYVNTLWVKKYIW